MKKLVIIILISIVLLIVGVYSFILLYYHSQIIPQESSVSESTLSAENSKYEIYESIVLNSSDTYKVKDVVLTIVEKKNKKEVCKISPCRALDYHGVYFLKGSNDFIVKSNDKGDLRYAFNSQNNSWDYVDE